jgi:hypothetical protein
MKKKIIIGTLSAVVVLGMAAGCSPQPKNVSTGASNNVQAGAATQTDAPKKDEKKFKADFSKDFKYVKVNVSEIDITPDKITVGLNYENTSGEKLHWFPEQGQLVVGDMQLNVDPLIQSNLVTGDIAPETKSDGVLVFKPQGDKKIDVSKVNKLIFHLNEVITEDLSASKKVDFEIPVK